MTMTTTTVETLVVGDVVLFGRDHGEKTLGRVIKVNRATVKVEQLESRGGFKDHPVGTKWNVSRTLCWKQGAGAGFVRVEPRKTVPASFLAPPNARPEAEIMLDIASLYSQLSPENLSCDGELPYREVMVRAKQIEAKLDACFRQLGRRVSEDEAYSYGRLASVDFTHEIGPVGEIG